MFLLFFATDFFMIAIKYSNAGKDGVFHNIGQNYIGVYLVAIPVSGALDYVRGLFDGIMISIIYPAAIILISYFVVGWLNKLPIIQKVLTVK